MAPKRLTEAEKQEILDLYRRPEESTSTLASRFGVSNSTISRILKQGIPDEEYETLVQQKRSGPRMDFESADFAAPSSHDREAIADQLPIFEFPDAGNGKVKPAKPVKSEKLDVHVLEEIEEDLMDVKHRYDEMEVLSDEDELDELDDEDELDILDEDEDLDDLEDEDEFDDEDEDGDFAIASIVSSQAQVEILPFASAKLPRTCYVVVDRSSELITRPLKEFAELGQIPEDEIQAKTLPIFDNHRVARRFSRRMQRVVKVPDGRMFYKVTESLQSKGITRLLIDGQVYSLT